MGVPPLPVEFLIHWRAPAARYYYFCLSSTEILLCSLCSSIWPNLSIFNMSSSDLITKLNDDDVLFGRGSGPNDHEGNIRFRALVSERKNEYLATNNRQAKAKIARQIVNEVLSKNGRFLKKAEAAEAIRGGIPKGVDAWVLVDDKVTMEKAKQALRQNREKGNAATGSQTQGTRTISPTNKYYDDVGQHDFGTQQNADNIDIRSDFMPYAQESLPAPNVGFFPSHSNSHAPVLTDPVLSQGYLGSNTADVSDISKMQSPDSTELMPQTMRSSVLSNTMRESFQISDLTSSFRNIQTKEVDDDFDVSETFIKKYFDSSADTMGTIDENPDEDKRESMGTRTARSLMRGSLLASGKSTFKGSLIDSVIDPNIFKSRRVSELRFSKSSFSVSDRDSNTMQGLRDSTISAMSAMSILDDDLDDMSELRSSMMSVDQAGLAGLRDSTNSANSVSESIFSDL